MRNSILYFIFLFREIGQKCPQDLAREASGVKGYATFISELAEQIPALVLANMSVLLPHLDGEVRFCKVTCPEKANGRDAAIQFFCLETKRLSQCSNIQNLLYWKRFCPYLKDAKETETMTSPVWLSLSDVREQETAYSSEVPALVRCSSALNEFVTVLPFLDFCELTWLAGFGLEGLRPLSWLGTPSTRPGCSKSNPTWP